MPTIDEIIDMLTEISDHDDRTDAERWRKLIRFIGSSQNGSDTTVKLFWNENDAPCISVGKNGFCQPAKDFGDFSTLIDSIPEYQEGIIGDNE